MFVETSLVVQWVRLCAPNAGVQVQSLVRELDPSCFMLQLRSPHAATERSWVAQLRPGTAKIHT